MKLHVSHPELAVGNIVRTPIQALVVIMMNIFAVSKDKRLGLGWGGGRVFCRRGRQMHSSAAHTW